MTRNGKIARLPLTIREELTRRLENGEMGVGLVEWLNGLPEVKKVLAEEFGGAPINDMNLSYWKNGGVLDWQAQQKAESTMERWQSQELAGATSDKLAESLKERLMVHYAAALEDAVGETDEKARDRVERLGRSLRDMLRARRYDLAREHERERVKMEREWLVLSQQRTEDRVRKKFEEWATETGLRAQNMADAERGGDSNYLRKREARRSRGFTGSGRNDKGN